jgi:hypothetical protein
MVADTEVATLQMDLNLLTGNSSGLHWHTTGCSCISFAKFFVRIHLYFCLFVKIAGLAMWGCEQENP